MRLPTALAAATILAACGPEKPEEPRRDLAADSVDAAETAFDAAAFDTITWDPPADAIVRGSVVYQFSCRKCHGTSGYGDGRFVTRGDTLKPPSFHQEDWKFAGRLDSLRKQVYIGTTEGMPHWGLEGLKYRDIDGVAKFILELREKEAGTR